MKPDLVTVMIGINDGWSDEVGVNVGEIVEGIRVINRDVPVAVITPVDAGDHWDFAEDNRQKIREEVHSRARHDKRLRLVEGKALAPLAYFAEGLHPSSRGYQEIALNLFSSLGFSPVHFNVQECSSKGRLFTLGGTTKAHRAEPFALPRTHFEREKKPQSNGFGPVSKFVSVLTINIPVRVLEYHDSRRSLQIVFVDRNRFLGT